MENIAARIGAPLCRKVGDEVGARAEQREADAAADRHRRLRFAATGHARCAMVVGALAHVKWTMRSRRQGKTVALVNRAQGGVLAISGAYDPARNSYVRRGPRGPRGRASRRQGPRHAAYGRRDRRARGRHGDPFYARAVRRGRWLTFPRLGLERAGVAPRRTRRQARLRPLRRRARRLHLQPLSDRDGAGRCERRRPSTWSTR